MYVLITYIDLILRDMYIHGGLGELVARRSTLLEVVCSRPKICKILFWMQFFYAHMLIRVCFNNLYWFNFETYVYPWWIGRVGSASQYAARGRGFQTQMLQKSFWFYTYAFFVFLTFIFSILRKIYKKSGTNLHYLYFCRLSFIAWFCNST